MTLPVPPINNANIPQWVLQLAQTIYEMLKGRDNSVSTVTLTPNSATTVVTDNLFSSDMMPILTATTANAAGAVSGLYVSARSAGTFTLTHANTAAVDKTFLYSRRG